MISSAERKAQKWLTSWFIGKDFYDLILMRSTLEDDGAGGYVRSDRLPLLSQRVRLILQDGLRGAPDVYTGPDGTVYRPDWVVMGESGLDIRVGDRFNLPDTQSYEIIVLMQNTQYQVKAGATRVE